MVNWRGQEDWSAEEELDYQLSKIDSEGAFYYLIDYTSDYSPREAIQTPFTAIATRIQNREEELAKIMQDAEYEIESLNDVAFDACHEVLRKFARDNGIEWGY